MSATPGSRLGPYEVLAPLGAGGMGEVYRARDSKLNRDVALKVLPDLFTEDPDRLTRFRREAQVLASLNHPNIGHIYGFEDSGPTHALVLELVEGPTLADRMAQGQIPLDEALPIARQIADALECAHEQNIVHRDLKPANIKVRPDGTVKVLDFGLAKALEGADAADGAHATQAGSRHGAMNSPTLTAHGTQMGVIIGTAAYMAPEQARGRAIDRRADIWAFGVILFEMLSGKRAFEGEDISITLASVLKDEVKWSDLPDDLPPSVRRVLRRCLEKDPKRRLSAIADARLEFDDTADVAPVAAQVATARPATWKTVLPWTIAGLMAAATIAILFLFAPWRQPPARAPIRVSADIGVQGQLAVNVGPAAVLSPDGQTAVFVVQTAGRNMLYVRKLDQLQTTPLPGTEDAHLPFFSPDSQWIGFFAPGALKKVAASGGTPVRLCDAPNGRGGWWGTDGTIIFQPHTRLGEALQRVPDAGGTPTAVAKGLERGSQRWPQILPGGKALLYSHNDATIGWDTGAVIAQPLPEGQPKVLMRGAFHGRYVNTGHLLYIRDGTLFSVPFDAERLELQGEPSPVVHEVLSAVNTGGAQFSVSDSGTLLYVPGKSLGNDLPVTWLERSGKVSALREESAEWSNPAFSPDGQQLAMSIGFGPNSDIFLYEWGRKRLTQLTFGRGLDIAPVWTRDGARIAYGGDVGQHPITNLFWKRSDGTGDAQRLTESPNSQTPYAFDPTGRYLVYVERTQNMGGDIMVLPLAGDEKTGWKPGTPIPFLTTPANETAPAISRDGRWIAYHSDESGTAEIYVRPFPTGQGKWRISSNGGLNAVWSRAGDELFYAAPVSGQIAVMAATYQAENNSFRADPARQWFPTLIVATRPSKPFDVHPDGERIAIARPPDTVQQQRPVFVFNFFDLLPRAPK